MPSVLGEKSIGGRAAGVPGAVDQHQPGGRAEFQGDIPLSETKEKNLRHPVDRCVDPNREVCPCYTGTAWQSAPPSSAGTSGAD